MLIDMGFSEDRAKIACVKTNNNLEAAVDWLADPVNELVQMDIDPVPSAKPVSAPAPVDTNANAKIQQAAAALDVFLF